MKYLTLTTLAAALAFAAAPAFAAQPNGVQWPFKTDPSSNGSMVGQLSSQIPRTANSSAEIALAEWTRRPLPVHGQPPCSRCSATK
jgi:hypothetical protein